MTKSYETTTPFLVPHQVVHLTLSVQSQVVLCLYCSCLPLQENCSGLQNFLLQLRADMVKIFCGFEQVECVHNVVHAQVAQLLCFVVVCNCEKGKTVATADLVLEHDLSLLHQVRDVTHAGQNQKLDCCWDDFCFTRPLDAACVKELEEQVSCAVGCGGVAFSAGHMR